jgi:hypothetical protein
MGVPTWLWLVASLLSAAEAAKLVDEINVSNWMDKLDFAVDVARRRNQRNGLT